MSLTKFSEEHVQEESTRSSVRTQVPRNIAAKKMVAVVVIIIRTASITLDKL